MKTSQRPLLPLFVAFFLSAAQPVGAVEPGEALADPVLEARARAISQELRCLVCQSQSIDDSEAALARDLRMLVRERLAKGDDDAMVLRFVTRRYGDFVLLRPPFVPATWLLWLGPLGVLIGGGAYALMSLRRAVPAQETLTVEERRHLAALLGEGKDG